jgi:hypothetical protein
MTLNSKCVQLKLYSVLNGLAFLNNLLPAPTGELWTYSFHCGQITNEGYQRNDAF